MYLHFPSPPFGTKEEEQDDEVLEDRCLKTHGRILNLACVLAVSHIVLMLHSEPKFDIEILHTLRSLQAESQAIFFSGLFCRL